MEEIISVKKIQRSDGVLHIHISKEARDKLRLKPQLKLTEKIDVDEKRLIYELP